ncbi:uncharacterized mitochondrial protein AtMg00810-like [Impatiens glandulifera]|uniref:uncharacterized mitochondrial protein AtMg00810-like n=1 Tax=Impatiens glandulifera TaxID=253017 RepID=UPI001FB08B13|nr:uncharacterized mitochondrial protein AtMg00810-like [Impatiens glandulifera]
MYVDDMIITCDDHDGIESLKSELAHSFAMKDLGMLQYFLGIKVAYSPKGYLLSQFKYIVDLFEHVRLTDNRIVDTPLETNARYSSSDGTPLEDSGIYRTIVSNLVYFTVTCLDIAHAVHVVSQFITSPITVHWVVVLCILMYLRGTQFHSLMFPSTSSLELRAYSDVDWAGDPTNRKSTTGYCIFLGDSLISWKRKNKMSSLDLLHKLSILPWPRLPVKLFGYANYLLIWVFLSLTLLRYIVIINVLSRLYGIMSFLSEPNISRLIVMSLVII